MMLIYHVMANKLSEIKNFNTIKICIHLFAFYSMQVKIFIHCIRTITGADMQRNR